ncbi:hypothetical protein [Legionella adelaidensis]|uniref:hypothetical protein n=1 Tax=Legionella adelaidensis TaxID=45056 RepID=UPI00073064A1|nr:hypothetical protein [Legionella adelaidensis]
MKPFFHFYILPILLLSPSYALAEDCDSLCAGEQQQCFNTILAENYPRDASRHATRTCSETFLLCKVECARREDRAPLSKPNMFMQE